MHPNITAAVAVLVVLLLAGSYYAYAHPAREPKRAHKKHPVHQTGYKPSTFVQHPSHDRDLLAGTGLAPGAVPHAASHAAFHAGAASHAAPRAAMKRAAPKRAGEDPPANPEAVAEHEQAEWLAAAEADGTGDFDVSLGHDLQLDSFQYHQTMPALDYNTMITDELLGPREKENHEKWVSEMKPWSTTAKTVDNMDEALEASTPFVGLRRPQAVRTNTGKSLQVTELDANTFAKNSKFNFLG
jgi:hypothetical protein